jgi:plastocyanin
MSSRAAATVLVALLLVGVAALPALAAEVVITADGFEPDTLTIAPGQAVTWTNVTDSPVTLLGEDGSWDSGPIRAGDTFSLDLRRAGTYAYSTDDGRRTGTILVVAPADEPADEPDEVVDGGALPTTGLPLVTSLLAAGLLLVAGGTLLLRARVRRGRA